METPELNLILKNCFTRQKLQSILQIDSEGNDLYNAAVEAILCEEDAGLTLSQTLDNESERQQSKIHSMNLRELRNSLSIEFLEPGRTLGLIVWSLMRDDRIGARNLAGDIARRLQNVEPPYTADAVPETIPELRREETTSPEEIQEETLDESLDFEDIEIEELIDEDTIPEIDETIEDIELDDDEIEEILETTSESSDETEEEYKPGKKELKVFEDDKELDSLIAELTSDDSEEEISITEEDWDEDMEPEEEETLDLDLSALEEESVEDIGLESAGEVDDVDELIASLADEEEQEETKIQHPLDLGEEENETNGVLGLDISEEDFSEIESVLQSADDITDIELEDDEELDEALFDEDVIDSIESELQESDISSGGDTESVSIESEIEIEEIPEEIQIEESITEIPEELLAKFMEDSIPESVEEPTPEFVEETMTGEMEKPADIPPKENMVALGGVEISLSSLQQACERIFNEPIQLVADSNLVQEDKIVVVGKRCGVRILYGPHYVIQQAEEIAPDSEEPVCISPVSLQSALSRVYDEPVEIVPDPDLLKEGIVTFVSQKQGVIVIKNPHTQVTLPAWVDSTLQAEIQSYSAEREIDLIAMSEQIQTLQETLSTLQETITESINKQLQTLQEKDLGSINKQLQALQEKDIDSISEQFQTLQERINSLEERLSLVTKESSALPMKEVTIEETIPIEDISSDEVESSELVMETEPAPTIPVAESPEEELVEPETALEEITPEIVSEESDEEETELDLDALDAMISNGENEDAVEEEIALEDLDILTAELDENVEDILGDEATSDDLSELEETEEEDLGDEEIDLDGLDLEGLDEALDTIESPEDEIEDEETGADELEEELDLDQLDEELDLDILDELDEEENGFEPKPVYNGENILLLGGEEKNEADYLRVVDELGGKAIWRANLTGAADEDITELVEQSDLILTLSSDAVADPGILKAKSIAEENNKRLFEHHSSNPTSVQKQLMKLVEEGNV